MVQNYNSIIDKLNQFANAHLSLKRFKVSFFDQMDPFTSDDNTFPILYVVPNEVSFQDNIDVISFRVYCVDILQKDRSNEQVILNETLLILRDLTNWLRESNNDLNILNTPRAIPVNNFGSDFTTGWFTDFEIEAATETTDCSIPFSSGFQLTGFTCSDTYINQYLTCETLEECQGIIDIWDEIAALSGASASFTGGTVSGATNFTGGLTANTFSATTYQNLPLDIRVTGGTYTAGTAVFTNNTGGTFSVSGFSTGSTSSTTFTGGTVSGATNFINGLSATTFSATTYLGLPLDIRVTGGTYTNGNAIFTNNTGGTFSVTGFPIGGGGGQLFYLNISQSKNGNRYLSTTGSTASEQSTGTTIGVGATGTIASFQSDQLNTTLIPGGIWSFYLHSYKQNTNASFNIFVEVYKLSSGGTQTLLFTTDPTEVTTNSPNPSIQLSDAYFSGSPITVTDSILAVVRAINTSNQSHTITLFSEGNQHYSYVVSTLPTQQGLTCDTLSGCSIIQTIQSDILSKLNTSGGTITGNLIVNGSLNATTYQNLPLDIRVTGGTKSGNVATFTNNTGGTFTLTGLSDTFVTGGTYSSSAATATFTNNTGGTFSVTGFSSSSSNNLSTFKRVSSSYTLDSTDLASVNSGQNLVIEMSASSTNTFTVPPNSAVTFSIGTSIDVSQYSSFQTTITPGLGVSLRSSGGFLKLAAQYSFCTLLKVGTNEWYVVGQLAP